MQVVQVVGHHGLVGQFVLHRPSSLVFKREQQRLALYDAVLPVRKWQG